MREKQHEPIAFELAQSVKIQNQKILYLCDSDKEARLIKNELLLFMNDDEIGYYPEREILPYDRFSTADSIIQQRIKLLNADKTKIKIIITSCINLFEKLPSKNFFISRKIFKIGDMHLELLVSRATTILLLLSKFLPRAEKMQICS